MRTYIDVWNAGEGVERIDIARRMESIGMRTIAGHHDWFFDWSQDKDFKEMLSKVHKALQGSGVFYRTETLSDEEVAERGERVAQFLLPV
jgi:hypothetical protein